MIFNADHLPVWEFDRLLLPQASLCPLCGADLVARRCEEGRRSHWAHFTKYSARTRCPWEESAWHLCWKFAYLSYRGWTIEQPLSLNGKRFILDAARLPMVREFVHSLSPYYTGKHLALKAAGLNVLWIFDGDEFASKRRRHVAKGGIKRLLRPRAKLAWDKIGGVVHFGGAFWRHWRSDVWFPIESRAASGAVLRYEAERARFDRAARSEAPK